MSLMPAHLAAEALHIDWNVLRTALWAPMRRADRVEDKLLLLDTQQWLRSLPRGARPVELPKRFARIANELCRLWSAPAELEAYFASLLVDTRGDRQGFPALVHEELCALHHYSHGMAALQSPLRLAA
jgi:hypothetical protein